MCLTKGLAPPDIQSLAKKTITNCPIGPNSKGQQAEERRILRLIIVERNREVCNKKFEIKTKMKNHMRLNKLSHEAKLQFNIVRKNELNNRWVAQRNRED